MKLIVGLGNPGKEYIGTRHNLGFAVVSKLRKCLAPPYRWRKDTKFVAEISEARTAGEEIILMRPTTFMNRSGEAVAALVAEERIQPADVWVIHDDIDLPLGTIRIGMNSASGGHRGVESVIKELGTKNFTRFRLGVAPDRREIAAPEEFVLKRFEKTDLKTVILLIDTAVEAIRFAIGNGVPAAMNRFNNKPLLRQSRYME